MIPLKQIDAFCVQHPDRAAIVAPDATITWRELRAQTRAIVAHLNTHYGANPPRQACYVAGNRADLFPWLAAFATLAIPSVGLDYTLPADTLNELVTKAGADFTLLSSRRLAGGLPDTPGLCRRDNGTLFDLDTDSARPGSIAGPVAGAASARPFRSLGFTSGTTGVPKAVLRSRSFDARRFEYFATRYGFTADDRFFVSLPLYHAAGNGWARLFMSLGATLFVADDAADAELAAQLARHDITATVMSPVLLAGTLDHCTTVPALPALRWLLVGGRNFNAVEKQRALGTLGPVVYEYYGTTESGVNTIAEPDDLLRHPASVGRAYDGNRIAIVDADGARVPAGQPGSVCIASYMLMDDYADGGGRFVALDDGERYFVTPDQGYLDDSGRLFLLNRSGHADNLAPLYRLENALHALPCIRDVALLQHGAAVQCAYTVNSPRTDGQRLAARIRALADDVRIPLSQCRQIESIPYSPSGKVRVHDLQQAIAAR